MREKALVTCVVYTKVCYIGPRRRCIRANSFWLSERHFGFRLGKGLERDEKVSWEVYLAEYPALLNTKKTNALQAIVTVGRYVIHVQQTYMYNRRNMNLRFFFNLNIFHIITNA